MPATPLEVTAADVLAWDRQRGKPPLGGFTPEQEQAILARLTAAHRGPDQQAGNRGRTEQAGVKGAGARCYR